MSRGYRNTHIAPRVVALCAQKPRTAAQVMAEFPADEARLARFALYNMVKKGLLVNVTRGKCGNGKVGRFVAVTPTHAPPLHKAPDGYGEDLARAWGMAS
jgi:hypothetical protein